MDWKVTLDAIGAAFVGGGFLLASWTFWRNTRIRRAEWLASLYEMFYLITSP